MNLLDLCILVATDWFMNIESRIEMMFFYVLVNLLDLCILVATDSFMKIESRI